MNYYNEFRVKPDSAVDLSAVNAAFTGGFVGAKAEEKAKKQLKKNKKYIAELQEQFYAEGKHSLLIVMQAPDAAGKDGTIDKVFGAMNPQGCNVYPFKAPSSKELSHDFLWRIHQAAPAKGHVSVFNRSHYEDVLIVRVRNLVPDNVWKRRYDKINNFEEQIAENDTGILKFYLHISKEEQLKRLWKRVETPLKHWKVNNSDYTEREKWDEYQEAYQDIFNRCSTDEAPWFVIPGDNKWFSRLAVSEILISHLESLNMQAPDPEADIEMIKKDYFGIKKEGGKPRFDLI